jgi:hypothetical protein
MNSKRKSKENKRALPCFDLRVFAEKSNLSLRWLPQLPKKVQTGAAL